MVACYHCNGSFTLVKVNTALEPLCVVNYGDMIVNI